MVLSLAIGAYLILWLLTQMVGSPRVLNSERMAQMSRLGSAYAEEPMRARAWGPFVVSVDRFFAFSILDRESGRSEVRTFKTTSLYLWIGTSVKLADGLWESEVKTPPGS